jgi:hypothetical protein
MAGLSKMILVLLVLALVYRKHEEEFSSPGRLRGTP